MSYAKKKKKTKHRHYTLWNINSKWITDLCGKRETLKLLEGNIGKNLDDLGYGDDFLDTTSKTWATEEIVDMQDVIKVKNFCSVKCSIKRLEDWEKIIAKYTSYKGWLFKVYNELSKFNNNKTIRFLNGP